MNGIRTWIEAEGTGHWFFAAFPVVLICLFIWFKGRRVRFLIPSLIVSIAIVNPVFYRKWVELGLYAYWRVLWVIPVIPVLACLIPSISEKVDKTWAKAVLVTVGVGAVALCGTFLYTGTSGGFSIAANTEKLPDYVVKIADSLLKLDEHPRAVLQHPVGTYLRQYTGEIDQMYGRNIEGFILAVDRDVREVYNQLMADELDVVAAFMADNDYQYLVMDGAGKGAQLADAGFELIESVDNYGIYRGHGRPTVVKRRNTLGQVISVTTVDEDGNPVNTRAGYSTISYEYDRNGNVIREYYTDVDGFGAADSDGVAGYEYVYNNDSRMLLERTIDPEGKAVENYRGYAERRRTYSGKDVTSEAYFNAEGQPVDRIDTMYSTVRYEYDPQHHCVDERYYDRFGEPVASNRGYARVARGYDDKYMTSESYFDVEDRPVTLTKGYSSIARTCDVLGRVLTESYLDAEGNAVSCINGFASVSYEYDSSGNAISQCFRDVAGAPVVTPAGYAEVRRIYDGEHLVREEYFGANGEPLVQPAGHVAIVQEWDGRALASRSYLDAAGIPINRTDGYSKAVWTQAEKRRDVHFFNVDGQEVEMGNLNLAGDVKGGPDGWSEWMVPIPDTLNSGFDIGQANLGPKVDGDIYTCALEIEFRNVKGTPGQTFRFLAQGAQDRKWFTGNVWNTELIRLYDAPADGVYRFSSTVAVSGDMVDVSTFNLGFRCDYWRSGMFRVRHVQIEKGDACSAWKSGL